MFLILFLQIERIFKKFKNNKLHFLRFVVYINNKILYFQTIMKKNVKANLQKFAIYLKEK